MFDFDKPRSRAGWAVFTLGAVLLLVGALLLVGGITLISLGGSWYYAIAGALLVWASLPIMQRRVLGAWIYGAAFLLTLIWAFWEVGLQGWPLVPRLAGPLVLLLLVILALPVLDTERGKRWRLFGLGGFGLLVIVLGVAVAQANRPDPAGALPEASLTMNDPAAMDVGAIGLPTPAPTARSAIRR